MALGRTREGAFALDGILQAFYRRGIKARFPLAELTAWVDVPS